MKKVFALCLLLLFCHAARAQQKKVDSLLIRLDHAQSLIDVFPALVQLKLLPGGFLAAINQYRKELNMYEEAGDLKNQERVLLALCTIMSWEFNAPEQLQYALKGLHISRITNDNYYPAHFLLEAAVAYDQRRDLHKAGNYFRLCAIVARAARDTDLTLTSYSNLQTIYARNFMKPDSALYFARCESQLYLHVDTAKHWENISTTLTDCGEAFASAKKLDSALIYYRRSYNLFNRYDRGFLNAELLDDMAEVYVKDHQPDSAIKYALEARRLAKIKDGVSFLYDEEAAGILSKIYEGHDDKKSFLYLKEQLRDKDSIDASGKNEQLQLVADQDKEHEQDLLVARDSFNARVHLYIVIGTAGVLLITGLILWSGYMNQKRNNRLLSDQKEEISTQRDHLETMIDQLKTTQRQLIQAEKMASLGELTAGIAHEIQNPLNFVTNFSEVNEEMLEELKAESSKPKAARDEQLESELINDLIDNQRKIKHHGKRADSIVKGMLEHSRPSSNSKEPTDINNLTDECLRLAYHGLRAKDKSFNAEMVTRFDENLPLITIVPQDVGRVLLNMFNNAFYSVSQKAKSAPNDYHPTVTAETFFLPGEGVGGVTVGDNGSGIADDIKDKIMQPFFTTKPTGEGTGLGLSLSYDIIVKGHGGSITVETKEGEFTEFTIKVPYV